MRARLWQFMNAIRRKKVAHPTLKTTTLYDYHITCGAKMINFANFMMPMQYADSIIDSHNNVRNHGGAFDVSHMLQTYIHGKHNIELMESLTVADIKGLKPNHGTLSVFTNDAGGIIDDLIVHKTEQGYLYVVSNAANRDSDMKLMQKKAAEMRKKGLDVTVEWVDKCLFSFQGPIARKAVQPFVNFDLLDLTFMTTRECDLLRAHQGRVTRCGYTGEDGFELAIDPTKSLQYFPEIMHYPGFRNVGLGARDTLRQEAGLCLYGNDIDETTTPVEASLAWTIGKRRREEGGFPGHSVIMEQLKNKPPRRRVGFMYKGPIGRHGCSVFDETGEKKIGQLTSGCLSPTLRKNISMGYVLTAYIKPGTKVKFLIHKKMVDAEVTKMPFVPTKYFFEPEPYRYIL